MLTWSINTWPHYARCFLSAYSAQNFPGRIGADSVLGSQGCVVPVQQLSDVAHTHWTLYSYYNYYSGVGNCPNQTTVVN